jgi:hypothetical protein
MSSPRASGRDRSRFMHNPRCRGRGEKDHSGAQTPLILIKLY